MGSCSKALQSSWVQRLRPKLYGDDDGGSVQKKEQDLGSCCRDGRSNDSNKKIVSNDARKSSGDDDDDEDNDVKSSNPPVAVPVEDYDEGFEVQRCKTYPQSFPRVDSVFESRKCSPEVLVEESQVIAGFGPFQVKISPLISPKNTSKNSNFLGLVAKNLEEDELGHRNYGFSCAWKHDNGSSEHHQAISSDTRRFSFLGRLRNTANYNRGMVQESPFFGDICKTYSVLHRPFDLYNRKCKSSADNDAFYTNVRHEHSQKASLSSRIDNNETRKSKNVQYPSFLKMKDQVDAQVEFAHRSNHAKRARITELSEEAKRKHRKLDCYSYSSHHSSFPVADQLYVPSITENREHGFRNLDPDNIFTRHTRLENISGGLLSQKYQEDALSDSSQMKYTVNERISNSPYEAECSVDCNNYKESAWRQESVPRFKFLKKEKLERGNRSSWSRANVEFQSAGFMKVDALSSGKNSGIHRSSISSNRTDNGTTYNQFEKSLMSTDSQKPNLSKRILYTQDIYAQITTSETSNSSANEAHSTKEILPRMWLRRWMHSNDSTVAENSSGKYDSMFEFRHEQSNDKIPTHCVWNVKENKKQKIELSSVGPFQKCKFMKQYFTWGRPATQQSQFGDKPFSWLSNQHGGADSSVFKLAKEFKTPSTLEL